MYLKLSVPYESKTFQPSAVQIMVLVVKILV